MADEDENRPDAAAVASSGEAIDGQGEPVEWRSHPCPVCQKMSDRKYRPFCSRHCADVDLARWLGGRYAIPARPADRDELD